MKELPMILISGFAFGLVIGYLSWFAIKPGEKGFTMRTVAAFISTVIGAGVTLAFPAGTNVFTGYSIGLATGFFFTPSQKWFFVALENRKENIDKEKKKKTQSKQDERRLFLIDEWPKIEKVISDALRRSIFWVEKDELLRNLPFDDDNVVLMMSYYAYLHHDRVKFEYSVLNGEPRLTKIPLDTVPK
ncbi:MAG: hypothetical protein AB1846_19690 [Chloroflexota bacterium]